MKHISTLHLMTILVQLLYPSVALSITPEDVASQVAQREENIKSIYALFSVKTQFLTNDGNVIELEKQYEWLKDGIIQKITEEFKSVPSQFIKQNDPNIYPDSPRIITEKIIQVYDGKITKRFLPESKTGYVFLGSDVFFAGKVPEDWLLLRFQKMPLSFFLKKNDLSLKYTDKFKSEEQALQLLEFTKAQFTGKLFFTDELGLVPVRFETYKLNPNLPYNTRTEYLFSEFKRYDNLTLPTKIILDVYSVYPDREQKVVSEVVVIEQLEVNHQIPETNLQLRFPRGTRIHDSISGANYDVVY